MFFSKTQAGFSKHTLFFSPKNTNWVFETLTGFRKINFFEIPTGFVKVKMVLMVITTMEKRFDGTCRWSGTDVCTQVLVSNHAPMHVIVHYAWYGSMIRIAMIMRTMCVPKDVSVHAQVQPSWPSCVAFWACTSADLMAWTWGTSHWVAYTAYVATSMMWSSSYCTCIRIVSSSYYCFLQSTHDTT